MKAQVTGKHQALTGDGVRAIARAIIDDVVSMQQTTAATRSDYVRSDVHLCRIQRSARQLLAPIDDGSRASGPLAGLVAYVSGLEAGERRTPKDLACTLAALEFAVAKIRNHMRAAHCLPDFGQGVEAS
ncbi:hypothetical protein [Desulfofustis glycolicus]|uniref:Uncharacterized protein n=1 Tax=Desulfofustis glycolicus DSM 9705 TaxID=1121409 RepID=A0A1M5S7V2_9BACT|nr:hypothetical protein [Desulfofustis glycolicus]SHH34013.1 hypothetical protein SAMN02745124_00183 [Desulfofustis glycolicus DSM 9705]